MTYSCYFFGSWVFTDWFSLRHCSPDGPVTAASHSQIFQYTWNSSNTPVWYDRAKGSTANYLQQSCCFFLIELGEQEETSSRVASERKYRNDYTHWATECPGSDSLRIDRERENCFEIKEKILGVSSVYFSPLKVKEVQSATLQISCRGSHTEAMYWTMYWDHMLKTNMETTDQIIIIPQIQTAIIPFTSNAWTLIGQNNNQENKLIPAVSRNKVVFL